LIARRKERGKETKIPLHSKLFHIHVGGVWDIMSLFCHRHKLVMGVCFPTPSTHKSISPTICTLQLYKIYMEHGRPSINV